MVFYNSKIIIKTKLINSTQEILVDRAVHAAVSRFLPLHFAHNQNQNPTLVENDFSLAMNEFVPASMRDITKPAAEGGRSGWDDVGGLVEVKSSIKEVYAFILVS